MHRSTHSHLSVLCLEDIILFLSCSKYRMRAALHRHPRVRPVTCFPKQNFLNELGRTINNYLDILGFYSEGCLLDLRGCMTFHVQYILVLVWDVLRYLIMKSVQYYTYSDMNCMPLLSNITRILI